MGADGAQFREFRTLLESKERELITLCDQQVQSLHSQVFQDWNTQGLLWCLESLYVVVMNDKL